MKKLLLPMMLALCLPFAALAQDDTREMYTVYTEADSTLTFYYDNQKGSREGEAYELNTRYNQPAWKQKLSGTKKVIFDESFADARPTSTYGWFEGGGNWLQWPLKEIEGIENLNTSSVTNMANMFSCCNNLTSLDLSNFDTSNVTDMGGMFYCFLCILQNIFS